MSRIRSSEVLWGNSYVFNSNNEKLQANNENNPEKLKEQQALLDNAQLQAQEILNNAQAEAERILQETQEQAQNIFQQAQEEGLKSGYQEGYDTGYRQVQADLAEKINSLNVMAQAAFKIKSEVIASSEKEVLELSVVIAEKVIKQELETNPEIILGIIKAAINELKEKDEVRIIVNPKIIQNLADISEELKDSINGIGIIKLVEDKTIHENGVLVESADSRIDARLDTQIAEIARQLFEEMRNEPIINEDFVEEIDIEIKEPKDI